MAGMYGCYHGPEGLKEIAQRTHLLARIFAKGIEEQTDFDIISENFFDTVVIETNNKTRIIHDSATPHGI